MTTRVYGASDDLVEVDGDIRGEVGHYASSDNDGGVLLVFSDGTVLSAKYGKSVGGIWALSVVRYGDLFESLAVCMDEDADPYSDVVTFKDGLKWAISAKDWGLVK